MAVRDISREEADNLDEMAKWELFSPYLRRYGRGSLAYSTLQKGMAYLLDESLGYVAYRDITNRRFVLSNPIAVPHSSDVLDLLHAQAKAKRKLLVYCQISHETARYCSQQGLYVNSIGIENIIDLSDFRISWNCRKDLKRWLSSIGKQGINVRELPFDQTDQEQVKEISAEWLSTKTPKRELEFMVRPFVRGDEPGVRKFYGWKGQQLLSFCSFDPCYNDNEVVAYALNHVRASRTAPNGILDYTVLKAMEVLKREGLNMVHLGISPLHECCEAGLPFRSSPWTRRITDFLYHRLNVLYSFKKLGFHKDRYKAEKTQALMATQKWCTVLDILLVLRANRVV